MNNKKQYIIDVLIGLGFAISIILFVVVFVNSKAVEVNSKVYVQYEPSSVIITENESQTLVESVDKSRKSVVEINATLPNGTSAGSGVIYGTDGNVTYIVTNFHVIENATSFKVILYDGIIIEDVQLVGGDDEEDIAVLMLKGSNYKLATLREITEDSTIKLGETVFAIGNPLGKLGGSVTKGIISCLNREISIDNKVMNLMQTDVAINSGNSGGGLFDINGRLIGIVNAKVSATGVEGIAFAISIDNASKVANALIETHTHNATTLEVTKTGYIEGRIDLGFTATYTTLMQGFFVTDTGLFVAEISTSSNAYQQGVRVYDKITSITYKGETIQMTNQSIYNSLIKTLSVGDELTLNIVRGSSTYNITITAMQKVYSIS